MVVSMLVAVDSNWGIGNEGDLLVKIPEDVKFFRESTTGNVMIMGRKTLESFPGGKPLKDRVNIVVTRNPDYKAEGTIIVNTVEEALEKAKEFEGMDVYNVGGGQIFNAMMDYCDVALVTHIDKSFDADTFFPNLDEMSDWVLESESEEKEHNDMKYTFRKYVKRK